MDYRSKQMEGLELADTIQYIHHPALKVVIRIASLKSVLDFLLFPKVKMQLSL